ncbi:MAG: methyltransferase domain-containing protein, partial [Hyphomicrobiaceae bacterium]
AFVVRQELSDHASRNPGAYDVVTAFQVIEHVPDPKAFSRMLVQLLRPGGVLVLCAPLHPSPLTEIPNFLLNAPPHHLTWWNRRAMQTLADVLDVEPLEISELPPSPHAAIVGWMHRFSLVRPTLPPHERYFAHRWSWHASVALAYGLARLADRWLPPSGFKKPIDIFMAARKRNAPVSTG